MITPAFGDLKVAYVIHCVGPNVSGRSDGEVGAARCDPSLLGDAFDATFELARRNHVEALAFPAVSCGVFGYDVHDASRVALASAIAALREHRGLRWVEFVLSSRQTYDAFLKAALDSPSLLLNRADDSSRT